MDPLTSIGLVLWTLISLGLTLNVLHPLINRDRARPLSLIFGFGLGWLIGELTIQWILLNAGIFLLLLVFADLEVLVFSWMLGIHLFLWILLLVRHWLVLNQVEYLEDQMLNQLGTEFQMTEAETPPPKKFRQVNWKLLGLPASVFKNHDLDVEFNREFEAEPGLNLKLDLYRPRTPGTQRPLLIQIHGGGWIIGSRRQGAYLLLMALTTNRPEFQPGFEEVNTRVQGWTGFYGAYDFYSCFEKSDPENARSVLLQVVTGGTPDSHPEIYRQSSPYHWSSKNLPPGMMLQGEQDTLIPMEEALSMQNHLKQEAEENQILLRVPFAQHGFDIFPSITAQCLVPFVERYLVLQYQKLQQKRNNEHRNPDSI